MSLLRRIKASAGRLGGGTPQEAEMQQELDFHVEMETAALIRDGVPESDARRQAMVRLGGVEQVKEECRDTFAIRWMEDVLRDVQYGCRTLVRSPAFTLIAVLTLALGIGANTAIFSVVNGVLLKQFPFPDADRLVTIWENDFERDVEHEHCAPADFYEWMTRSDSFESAGYLVNYTTRCRNFMLQTDDSPIRVRGRHVSSGLFETLGVAPLMGRTFEPAEDVAGGARTAVLSHAFWQQHFGGDPDILGTSINIGQTFQIVGVMPPGFRIPEDADFWLSSSVWMLDYRLKMHGWHSIWVIARLKPGVTAEMAQEELTLLQQKIATTQTDEKRLIADSVSVIPFRDEMVGQSTRPALLVLLAAVGFVLLIACANVANLTLARSTARRREIAVRASLGAGRLRVIRQLLTESLLLSLLGAGLGVLVAYWGIDLIMWLRPDTSTASVREFHTDRFVDVSLDWPVLVFTLALSVATGVAFGLIPAIQTARIDVSSVMKEEGRGGTSSRTARRFGDALIVGEVALAFVLLVGACQMLLTFYQMQQRDPGLDSVSVLCAEIDLGTAQQKFPGRAADISDAVTRKVHALPGVVSVSAAGQYPLRESGWKGSFFVEGQPDTGDRPKIEIGVGAPGLFETLGVPLLKGRDFDERDQADAPHVAIVNEEFADKYFSKDEVLGQRIKWNKFNQQWIEIVGVVGNVRNHRLDAEVQPQLMLCYRQSIWTGEELGPILVVRTSEDPFDVVRTIRHEIEGEAEGTILKNLKTLEGLLASSSSRERFLTVLLGFFTTVAVLLAAVGVYGIIAYSTSQRRREIGIRLALGAQSGAIRRMIVGRALVLGSAGAVIGLAVSLALSQLMVSQLHGVAAANTVMLGGGIAFLLAVVSLASYLPARQAMRLDPAMALRHT